MPRQLHPLVELNPPPADRNDRLQALGNDCIERFTNGHVTFRDTHARTQQVRRMTLPVDAFLDRFLLHVLPRGFTKIRSYGLLSPTHRKKLEQARQLLQHHAAAIATRSERSPTQACAAPPVTPPSVACCPVCHAQALRFLQHISRSRAPP